jgi:hypothetical protein
MDDYELEAAPAAFGIANGGKAKTFLPRSGQIITNCDRRIDETSG